MSLPLLEIIIYIVAGMGAVLLAYGVFLEKEQRQDVVFMLGAACLFVYATSIENRIFQVAMGAFFLATLVEFVEILIGYHKHSRKL